MLDKDRSVGGGSSQSSKDFSKYKLNVIYHDDLKEFLYKNLHDVTSILDGCFKVYKIRNYDREKIRKLLDKDIAYFVLYKDKVVALATVKLQTLYFKSDKEQNQYTFTNAFVKDKERKLNSPLLEVLCRKKGESYKGVGRYLLNRVSDHLRETFNFDSMYVVPENVNEKIISPFYCGITKKYKESQERLIRYYEKAGFKVVPGKYDRDVCWDSNDIQGFVYLPLMRKQLG